jgi:hypothetical protein
MNRTVDHRSAATAVITAVIARWTTYAFPATVIGFDSCIRGLSGAFAGVLKMSINTWGKCHE